MAGSPLERLRENSVDARPVVEWADSQGYALLQRRPPAILVLDAPPGRDHVDLGRHVNSLPTLGPVVVLGAEATDRVEVMGAGARDAIHRDAPPAHIAGRIGRLAAPLGGGRPSRTHGQHPSSFLVGWLMARTRPFCCHDLRWRLGPVGAPLPLAEVRWRLRRG